MPPTTRRSDIHNIEVIHGRHSFRQTTPVRRNVHQPTPIRHCARVEEVSHERPAQTLAAQRSQQTALDFIPAAEKGSLVIAADLVGQMCVFEVDFENGLLQHDHAVGGLDHHEAFVHETAAVLHSFKVEDVAAEDG